jgi:hypothetical protein
MSTKTTQKTTASKKEFNLTPVLTMWIYKGKNGVKYLSGKTEDGTKLKGFFNGKKKNPKEPDIRIYKQLDKGVLEKDEFISLWVKLSKGGKKYISGKLGDKWVTGFFNSKAEIGGIIPYLNVYFSESKEETKSDVPEGVEEIGTEDDNDLPF